MRFIVQTAVVGTCRIEVDADTPEEAKELAVKATSLADVEEWTYLEGFLIDDDELLPIGA